MSKECHSCGVRKDEVIGGKWTCSACRVTLVTIYKNTKTQEERNTGYPDKCKNCGEEAVYKIDLD